MLGPLTDRRAGNQRRPFGAHLVHEPFATYRIELDVRTESAEALDGTWTDHGVATEQLTVSTGGAPADLTPYVQALGARATARGRSMRTTTCASPTTSPTWRRCTRRPAALLVADLFTAGGQHVEPEVIRSRTVLPAISSETAILLDALQSADCVAVDIDSIAGYDETIYRTRLATSTAYEVRISGGGLPDPVYRWSFVTSRYRTFAEHLADLRPLPWHERLAATAAIAPRSRRGSDPSLIVRPRTKRGARSGRPTSAIPIRTLPERPEVTLFWSAAGRFRGTRARARQPRAAVRVGPHRARRSNARSRCSSSRRSGRRPMVTWREVAHRLVRSLDGARAVLVPVDTSGQPVRLAPGTYRLEFDLPAHGRRGICRT